MTRHQPFRTTKGGALPGAPCTSSRADSTSAAGTTSRTPIWRRSRRLCLRPLRLSGRGIKLVDVVGCELRGEAQQSLALGTAGIVAGRPERVWISVVDAVRVAVAVDRRGEGLPRAGGQLVQGAWANSRSVGVGVWLCSCWLRSAAARSRRMCSWSLVRPAACLLRSISAGWGVADAQAALERDGLRARRPAVVVADAAGCAQDLQPAQGGGEHRPAFAHRLHASVQLHQGVVEVLVVGRVSGDDKVDVVGQVGDPVSSMATPPTRM